jgi:hypothetical protein
MQLGTTMKPARRGTTALAAGLLLGACSSHVKTTTGARESGGAVVIHHEKRLVCGDNFGAKLDWAPGSEATQLRRRVVEAMVEDTIADAENGLTDPGKWCVLTDTTGWKVPAGVRVEPSRPVEEIRRRAECRQLEIDPVMPVWGNCTFDGRPVQVITFLVRWWARPGETRSVANWKRGVEESSTYGAFRDAGRPMVVRLRQDEL